MTPLDPFTVEVIRHGLSAAAEEMSLVLMRSARSPLLREAGDLSSTLTDARGDLVAQGRDIPVHLGAMAYTIRELLRVRPLEKFSEGDALIYNMGRAGREPPSTNVKVVRPVFVDGTVIAFALSLAHWPDVGGTWPMSYYAAATDTFQEAIRIPPVPIATAAGVNQAVIDMIKVNVPRPGLRRGRSARPDRRHRHRSPAPAGSLPDARHRDLSAYTGPPARPLRSRDA